MRICDILAKPCWVTTFDPFLSLSLDKTLCKWSSCWRFVKHWPRLLQQTICPQSASTPFLKMFLYPLLACCQMEQAPSNCRRFNSNQHFHKFPLTTTSPKLVAHQKLWKYFWRLNANVRFQIELKHFALTIATKNVYNQKYFPSMPRIESCAAKPKIVPMVTIVKI